MFRRRLKQLNVLIDVLQGVVFNKDRFETSKKKNGEVSTMDVIRSPRGKGGRFTKKGEDSTLVSPSNPLRSFATVALATVRKHQRLMDMASTVPHIDDIAEAKAMIRSSLQGRALMAGS